MQIVPLYWVRALGGLLFIVGYFIGVYNIVKTIRSAKALEADEVHTVAVTRHVVEKEETFHRKLEGMVTVFSVLAFFGIAIGSVLELVPALSIHKYVPQSEQVMPFTALEQAGRDIYVGEGCYVCHSQMIMKHTSDVLRYGPASTIGESMYDRPFQWGSKRTGPDLARVGKKYGDIWHYRHMEDPRKMVEKSIMPAYPWLLEKKVNFLSLRKKLSVLKSLGVPYTEEQVAEADRWAELQAKEIAEGLKKENVEEDVSDKQIVALIAYLQALGQKGQDNESAVKNAELVEKLRSSVGANQGVK